MLGSLWFCSNAFFSDKSTSQLNRKASLSQLNPDVYRCLRRKIRFSRSLLLPFHPPISWILISTWSLNTINWSILPSTKPKTSWTLKIACCLMSTCVQTSKRSRTASQRCWWRITSRTFLPHQVRFPLFSYYSLVNIKHELVNPRFSKIHHKKNPKTVNLSNYASVLKELSKNQPRNAGNVMNSNTKLIEEFQRIDFKSVFSISGFWLECRRMRCWIIVGNWFIIRSLESTIFLSKKIVRWIFSTILWISFKRIIWMRSQNKSNNQEQVYNLKDHGIAHRSSQIILLRKYKQAYHWGLLQDPCQAISRGMELCFCLLYTIGIFRL